MVIVIHLALAPQNLYVYDSTISCRVDYGRLCSSDAHWRAARINAGV